MLMVMIIMMAFKMITISANCELESRKEKTCNLDYDQIMGKL